MMTLPIKAGSLLLAIFLTVDVNTLVAGLRVSPTEVRLDGPESSQQIVVYSKLPGDQEVDVTRESGFEIANANLAAVTPAGLLQPIGEGQGELVIRYREQTVQVPLIVEGLVKPKPVSFRLELLPTLTKARCNSGGCHGKAEGQNGFKLSVFGFDTAADFDALTKEARGRRISLAQPDSSLVLRKASAQVPHGGGLKLAPDSSGYRKLRRWIAEGARFEVADEAAVERIEVEPAEETLVPSSHRQLRVTAIDSRGHRRCVTAVAEYQSSAPPIADVDEGGLVHATDAAGEAVILVRYLGHVASSHLALPRPQTKFARPAESNFIDKLVWDKLQRLGIEPSQPADDATFMRRAYLDVIGVLPTADEARSFLEDPAAEKRAKLIDALLNRDEYADYWAMRWATILRNDRLKVTPQGAYGMHRWLRQQFADNRKYDALVREILTAKGPMTEEGPTGFYKVLSTPQDASRAVSQLFLGVRIECAQCHHHPSERWGQDDYAALAGFFTGIKPKKLPGGGESLIVEPGADATHPRTGEAIPTRALGTATVDLSAAADRRTALVDWMFAPDNPYAARIIVNRLWSHYFGRGLVEPIDDLRQTNPATNEPLMLALEAHLREVSWDLKAFTRTLLNSRAYQASAVPNDSNIDDQQNFSHAMYKPLPAEVLLDMVCQSTGVPEKFNGWPEGFRAVQVWDNRMPSYFFKIFGRPVRASVCECERSNEPSISQALHLLNSPEVSDKVGHRRGRARQLADSDRTPAQIVEELFLSTLSRFPSDAEMTLMLECFDQESDRRIACEDILWTLLNSKKYLYNH